MYKSDINETNEKCNLHSHTSWLKHEYEKRIRTKIVLRYQKTVYSAVDILIPHNGLKRKKTIYNKKKSYKKAIILTCIRLNVGK